MREMTCQEFESEWIDLPDLSERNVRPERNDGEAESRLPESLQQHLAQCSVCAAMTQDLALIRSEARRLRREEAPPDRVWIQLRGQLATEGLIHEPAPAAAGFGWFPRMPMGLAYAAVFLLAVGVMYMQSLLTGPGGPPTLVAAPEVPILALERIPAAVASENLDDLMQRVPVRQREIFVDNWRQVDTSIRELNNFVRENPQDSFAVDQLMRAIQQRELLRETFVRWEEF